MNFLTEITIAAILERPSESRASYKVVFFQTQPTTKADWFKQYQILNLLTKAELKTGDRVLVILKNVNCKLAREV